MLSAIAETVIYMLEPKSKSELEDPIVLAKKDVAEKWRERATEYNAKNGGKPWRYALISHDKISENMSIEGLV
jgi:type III restriction enzyme